MRKRTKCDNKYYGNGLCSNCNSLLGHSKDNVNILKSAIRYLVMNT